MPRGWRSWPHGNSRSWLAADLGLDLLQRGQIAGVDRRIVLGVLGVEAADLRGERVFDRVGVGVGVGGRGGGGADAGRGHGEVAAGGGALEQQGFERGGAQDAAVETGEDDRNPGGAEQGGEQDEAGRGGTPLDGGGEVAAVFEQDADDVEELGDVRGHGGGVAILWGIG